MRSDRLTAKVHSKLVEYSHAQAGSELQQFRKYEAGKTVFSSGETPKGIHFISTGRVKIIVEGDSELEPVVRLAGPYEFIGYVSLIRRSHYITTAVVVEEAQIQFIPKDLFLELMHEDVDFANMVVEILCKQIQERETTIENLVTKDAKQRLAMLLLGLEMASEAASGHEGSDIYLPKKEIAATIAVAPETVSRHLSEFEKVGYIKKLSNSIRILDRIQLLNLSEVRD